MATTQTRTRKGTAATSKVAKTPTIGQRSTATRAPAKKPVAKKAPAAKVAKQAARPGTAAKRASRKTAPSTGKAVAKAGPLKATARKARPKAPKVLDAFAQLRKLVLDALDDLKARDVVEVDVRGKSSVADLLVVASGTSSRHVKSIADEVVIKAKRAGVPPIGVEGQREAEWVLVDLGDVIVHVMLPRTREFYGLERLWSVGEAAFDELPASA